MNWKLFSALFTLIIAGCTEDRGNDLEGCWTGDQKVLSGYQQKWKRCLHSNGRYRIDFTSNKDGKTLETYEEGRWGYSNGIYTTIILNDNGEDSNPLDKWNQGVYIVESVDENKMIYISLRTGNKYSAYRINSN